MSLFKDYIDSDSSEVECYINTYNLDLRIQSHGMICCYILNYAHNSKQISDDLMSVIQSEISLLDKKDSYKCHKMEFSIDDSQKIFQMKIDKDHIVKEDSVLVVLDGFRYRIISHKLYEMVKDERKKLNQKLRDRKGE